jgi:hypothetical protein
MYSGTSIRLKVKKKSCLKGLSALIEMFYTGAIQYGGNSHIWISNIYFVIRVTKEFNLKFYLI